MVAGWIGLPGEGWTPPGEEGWTPTASSAEEAADDSGLGGGLLGIGGTINIRCAVAVSLGTEHALLEAFGLAPGIGVDRKLDANGGGMASPVTRPCSSITSRQS